MSTNYFVVQAQRDLATAQNNELQAILGYRKSLVELERLQQTTLQNLNITVRPAGGAGRTRRDRPTPDGPRRSIMKRALIVLLIIAAIGAGAGAYYMRRGGPEVRNTSPITRGDIVDTVGATGTLQAVTTVQVGSQVRATSRRSVPTSTRSSRRARSSRKLDPSLFEAQLDRPSANLLQSRANLTKAQSDLERTKVSSTDAQQKYTRAKELAARSLLPQSDLDAAKIAVDTAQASCSRSRRRRAGAGGGHQRKRGQPESGQPRPHDHHGADRRHRDAAQRRRRPDGRGEHAGADAVHHRGGPDEDAGQRQHRRGRRRPHPAGPARHVSVDAYPTEHFDGTVPQIRLQPVVVQNVTTYGTVIDVPNPI